MLERAVTIGKRLEEGLTGIAAGGAVAEARGAGAVWAVGLHEDARPAGEVRDRMLAAGVIPRPIGDRTVAVCPPLVTSEADVDRIVESFEGALA